MIFLKQKTGLIDTDCPKLLCLKLYRTTHNIMAKNLFVIVYLMKPISYLSPSINAVRVLSV